MRYRRSLGGAPIGLNHSKQTTNEKDTGFKTKKDLTFFLPKI
jgi:hypothetical protein